MYFYSFMWILALAYQVPQTSKLLSKVTEWYQGAHDPYSTNFIVTGLGKGTAEADLTSAVSLSHLFIWFPSLLCHRRSGEVHGSGNGGWERPWHGETEQRDIHGVHGVLGDSDGHPGWSGTVWGHQATKGDDWTRHWPVSVAVTLAESLGNLALTPQDKMPVSRDQCWHLCPGPIRLGWEWERNLIALCGWCLVFFPPLIKKVKPV